MDKNFHRRSIRLQKYDYSLAGAYFITICAQSKKCLFGEIAGINMNLNEIGQMVSECWNDLGYRFPGIELDAFVVMPNHLHGIIVLLGSQDRRGESCIRPDNDGDGRGEHKVRPYGTLPGTIGRIIQAFKSITTHQYIVGVKKYCWQPFADKLWQRNYYEHVIRDEKSLNKIREYIINNPLQWAIDRENPNRTGEDQFDLWLASFKIPPKRKQGRTLCSPLQRGYLSGRIQDSPLHFEC